MSPQTSSNDWRLFYRITSVTTLFMLVIIPIQIMVFVLSPIPTTTLEWFELYHSNPFLGMLHQDLLYVINNVFVALMYLTFYLSLKGKKDSIMLLSLFLGLLGIAAYMASNKSFEMLDLSRLYYSSTLESDRSTLLLIGSTMLSEWQGSAFIIYYILNGVALLLISYAMLNSGIYSNKMAIIGMISGFLMMVPSPFGTIGLVFSLASLIPWYIFSIFALKVFIKLAKAPQEVQHG